MATNRPPVQKVSAPALPRKLKYLLIPDHEVRSFFGLNTIVSDLQKITDGFSPDALNWITGDENDCIILRRGTALLGKTRNGISATLAVLGNGDVSSTLPFANPWEVMRSAASQPQVDQGVPTLGLTNCPTTADKYISRIFMAFSIDPLPPGATVVSAKLHIKKKGGNAFGGGGADGNLNMALTQATLDDPNTLTTDDFGNIVLNNPVEFAARIALTVNQSETEEWTEFDFNAAGLAYLTSLGGLNDAEFAIRGDIDVDDLATFPGYNYGSIYSSASAGNEPYLEIQWSGGSSGITGLGVGTRQDGTEVPFFSYGRKVKYYDINLDDTVESGSNILPDAAANDTFFIEPYENLAGAFVYLSSINSDIYKIPVANPGSPQQQGLLNYRGGIKFGQSRMILFNNRGANGARDLTGLYMSWIDRIILANFMSTTIVFSGAGNSDAIPGSPPNNLAAGSTYLVTIDGAGSGPGGVDTFKWSKNGGTETTLIPITPGFPQYLADGVTITFLAATGHIVNDTFTIVSVPAYVATEEIGNTGEQTFDYQLQNIPVPPSNGFATAFNVGVTGPVAAGQETFIDDGNGKLLSNFGGTGTVNYSTGLVHVVFSGPTVGDVTCSYYWEDSSQRGVLDMSVEYDNTKTPPARIPGSGRYYPQFDGGGNIATAFQLSGVTYAFHKKKTWQTQVPTNDDDASTTPSSNLPFRDIMGVSSPRGAYGSLDAVYFVNNANKARPQVYEIVPKTGATSANQAAPNVISEFLDLSPYAFDKAVVYVWDIYILVCCQQVRNGQTDDFNSRTFVYNTKTGAWDLTDYPASEFREFMGSLISGDPLSNNIFTLFSGFDDDNALIPNYWTSGYTNHGTAGQKTTQRMVVNGLIQSSQSIAVDVAYDGGVFVNIFTIEGDGSYVDRSQSISVGQNTIGSKIAGGGGEVFANPFEVEFGVNSDRYEFIRVRLRALNGGYAQINFYTFKIIKYKGERVPQARFVA